MAGLIATMTRLPVKVPAVVLTTALPVRVSMLLTGAL